MPNEANAQLNTPETVDERLACFTPRESVSIQRESQPKMDEEPKGTAWNTEEHLAETEETIVLTQQMEAKHNQKQELKNWRSTFLACLKKYLKIPQNDRGRPGV